MARSMKPKVNRAGSLEESSGYDRCQTPAYALDPLWPFLPPGATIWEPAAGNGNLSTALREQGHRVITSDILQGRSQNFFSYEPDEPYDMILTNPPYSVKFQWMARCFQLGKPFALLLP